jgi:hypothetical protein
VECIAKGKAARSTRSAARPTSPEPTKAIRHKRRIAIAMAIDFNLRKILNKIFL